MTAREKALAVALRSTQWRLDDAAFKAGAGNLTPDECAELIADLHQIAALVAQYADHALPEPPNRFTDAPSELAREADEVFNGGRRDPETRSLEPPTGTLRIARPPTTG